MWGEAGSGGHFVAIHEWRDYFLGHKQKIAVHARGPLIAEEQVALPVSDVVSAWRGCESELRVEVSKVIVWVIWGLIS